jgi:hypothetical protein
MKKLLLIISFLATAIVCNAQRELYIINKKKPAIEMRMPKGVMVKGGLYSGKKFSGALITVTIGYIVLQKPSSTINLDEIAWIRGFVYADNGGVEGYSRRFDKLYYDFIIK